MIVLLFNKPLEKKIDQKSYREILFMKICKTKKGYIPGDEDRPIDVLEWTQYGHLLSGGINGAITQYSATLFTVSFQNFKFGPFCFKCLRVRDKSESAYFWS